MMKVRLKKTIKYGLFLVGSLFVLAIAAIALIINFIFTPEKLTPVVLEVANKSLNAHLNMESVELTFFSTFPEFGLKIKEGTLVSTALNKDLRNKTDSLLSFREAVVAINPITYFVKNKISIHRFTFKDVSVYAFRDESGKANWDIMKVSSNTASEKNISSSKFDSEIEIKRLVLRHANLILDDRNTKVYTKIDDLNLGLKVSLTKEKAVLHLKFDNKNLLFWQQGELLANKISASMQTKIIANKTTFTLDETQLTLNGIKLDVGGSVKRDTVNSCIMTDLHYGLHAPSVETVLKMIPETYIKKSKIKADGEVIVKGTVKGNYGNQQLPTVSLVLQIKNASAKYANVPYAIDYFAADVNAFVDLMRKKPSYADLKIFRFKGANTDITAEGKVENLWEDPFITFHTTSTIDLDALAKTFPLQKGVCISGKLEAGLKLKCKLSSLLRQDIGRISLKGKLALKNFHLKDEGKNFDFTSHATFLFSGDTTLRARMDIYKIALKSKYISSEAERVTAKVVSFHPLDTTRLAEVKFNFSLNKLHAALGDTIGLFSGKTSVTLTLKPGKINPGQPLLGMKMRTDSLFLRANQRKLSLDLAGFDIQAERVKDSVWLPEGTIGFNKLRLRTPEFGLPVHMRKTSLNLAPGKITLQNASVRLGKSDVSASGEVYNLYKAWTRGELLKARLSVTSRYVDCNQLINALSVLGNDTTEVVSDTVATEIKLFVVPKDIDFELQANVKKVIFDKMEFENVEGSIDIKDQAVHLKNLTMKALDADMNAMVVYKSRGPKRGYSGFDFKIKDINIGKLVDFIPSLDTVVPMLRSFKGKVQFDVAAETTLDSAMNIKIPSLRSAIHIKGDSLVLMDGETFAEISKMLMFKNKKRNVFDSISVNIIVNDGNVTVYPFLVEIDRYKAAVGGKQGLDMNFNYHISILKSPLPFKAGVNITGNLDKMKFRIGKAKYKNDVSPVAIRKVDSTRINMGNEIVRRFRKVAGWR